MTDRALLGTTWTCERAGAGSFRCPRCGAARDFVRTRIRRRLTLMGRPVAPLGRPAGYVTCDDCGHAFRAAIADGAAAQPDVLAEDEQALLGIMSAVILSDSAVRPSEKGACREVFRGYMGRRLPSEAVDDLLRSSRARWGDPVDRLARIRCLVPERIKQRIVEAAYHVCTADGEMHREESVLLSRVGEALDLGPRQVRQAIDRAKRRPVGRF